MLRRGTLYPAILDSTIGRQMEVGYGLTPKAAGIHNALNARAFKSNMLSAPMNHPGNAIQAFRTTGPNSSPNNGDRILMGAALNRRRYAR